MKALPSLIAIGIGLSAACHAQRCPDPNSQRAAIGGDAIDGNVSLQQKPLKAAQVQLLSNGKTTWTGSTNDAGSFHIKGLQPGTYRLTVKGWGSTTIRVSPDLSKSFGYFLLLVDNECIETFMVIN